MKKNKLKLSVPKDCGNAPRRVVIRDFNVAFAEGDVDTILSNLSEEIVWDMVGRSRFEGKEKVAEFLESMRGVRANSLTLDHIITHGKEAAASGTITFADFKVEFSDIYVFENFTRTAKIKHLSIYAVETKGSNFISNT